MNYSIRVVLASTEQDEMCVITSNHNCSIWSNEHVPMRLTVLVHNLFMNEIWVFLNLLIQIIVCLVVSVTDNALYFRVRIFFTSQVGVILLFHQPGWWIFFVTNRIDN